MAKFLGDLGYYDQVELAFDNEPVLSAGIRMAQTRVGRSVPFRSGRTDLGPFRAVPFCCVPLVSESAYTWTCVCLTFQSMCGICHCCGHLFDISHLFDTCSFVRHLV